MKLDFIPFQEGRIACVKGYICRLYGMMICSILNENPERVVPEVITYRVPLRGEERIPMSPVLNSKMAKLDMVIAADTKMVTPKELFRMVDSVQYFHKINSVADALRATLQALKEEGASGHCPASCYFNLDFDILEDGFFHINGRLFKKDELLVVLADIQRFATGFVYLIPERELDEVSVVADRLQGLMKGMYDKGLWRGETEGKDYFFVDGYLFEKDWMETTRISFEEFKLNYNNVMRIIDPVNNNPW